MPKYCRLVDLFQIEASIQKNTTGDIQHVHFLSFADYCGRKFKAPEGQRRNRDMKRIQKWLPSFVAVIAGITMLATFVTTFPPQTTAIVVVALIVVALAVPR